MVPRRVFYGRTSGGEDVCQFTLENKNGLIVQFLNYGCRLTGILLPSARRPVNILLGRDSLEEYEADPFYLGALIGRYANRIKGAAFVLSGKKYLLSKTDGDNYLHGSFHKRFFKPEIEEENAVRLSYVSRAGEDGFPGELRVCARYSLDDENRFTMEYRALTDADTHVNLTAHPYFNLSGGADETIGGHILRLRARHFLEIGADLCPTGRFLESAGGPFDFSRPKAIGRDIGSGGEQLARASGYDHCFVLEHGGSDGLFPAAEASDASGARKLLLFTTQPGIQFYTGNFLSGRAMGKRLPRRSGFCLEPQHYPDSPNRPEFPSTLLRAGEEYHEKTVLQFVF